MPKKIKPLAKDIQTFIDDRGLFVPFIQNTDIGRDLKIKRVYYICNSQKNIIRGFHFHKKEWKLFTVVQGSAKFIALNPDNPKEKYEFVCSDRKSTVITIPPGFANGWMSLEDKTILLASSSALLEESLRDDKRFDPYFWGDLWTIKAR